MVGPSVVSLSAALVASRPHGRRAPRLAAAAIVAGVALAPSLAPKEARADGPVTAPIRLRSSVDVDIAVVGVSAFTLIASELLKARLVPVQGRWRNTNGIDVTVRNALRWEDPAPARLASDLSLFVVAPVFGVGMQVAVAGADRRTNEVGTNVLIVFQATLLAAVLNQTTKLVIARERPFVYALADDKKNGTRSPSDNNLSFFSGHTTTTFALAAAGGAVASLRGYRGAPYVWAGGGLVAVTTGYLRIAADKHWFSDVLVGALVGTAMGLVVPFVFHRRADTPEPMTSPVGPTPPSTGVAPAATTPFVFSGTF